MQLKSLLCFFSQTESREHIVAFNMLNYRSCKNLWKSCVEHHTFFQAKKLLPQEKNVLSQYWSLGSRNPKKWVFSGGSLHTSLKCKPDLVTPREQTSPGKEMSFPGGPTSWGQSCWWILEPQMKVSSGTGSDVSFRIHSGTSIPVACFCLLNSVLLRAPKRSQLQRLHHESPRQWLMVLVVALRQPLPPNVNSIRCSVIMNEWMSTRKAFQSQVTDIRDIRQSHGSNNSNCSWQLLSAYFAPRTDFV